MDQEGVNVIRPPEDLSEQIPQGSPRSGNKLWRNLLIGLGVLVVGIVIASFIPISEYAITPGTALDVRALIALPASRSHAHAGAVLLTDVNLISLRAIDYPYYALDHNAQLVPATSLTGPISAADYNEQGVIDMAAAREAATVVAFRAIGYKVGAQPSALVVYQAEPSSPAAQQLPIGAVIVSIDGHATPSLPALAAELARLHPGALARIAQRPLSSSKIVTSTLRLGVLSASTTSQGSLCVAAPTSTAVQSGHACLGLFIEQLVKPLTPFPVSIDSAGIVGPSAGLAFTLGLIEKLDRFDLTGGKKVAATGTMAFDGSVGDVGGVAQKTVAVRNAGARVFFVPPQELAVAKDHAGVQLKVFAVSNISQAIRDLERLGGRLSRLPAGAA